MRNADGTLRPPVKAPAVDARAADARWEGAGWGTLGDSITEANGYQPLVVSRLGFGSIVNYGKSGCPMTAGGGTDYGATVNIGRTVDPSLECVTVFAGVNDFRLHKPLGGPNSYDSLTYYGAYRTLIEQLLTANPYCRLNLWTPLARDKDGYDIHFTNEAGCRLGDYVEAVRQVGREYALPVLDLFAESGFHKLTLPAFTSDGLHPNAEGYRRIVDMAAAFLARL
ncbi:SGNH/GDSL hydrolase family protein [Paenibacillus piri]|uniref:SGNH/GDSL hydrolase family protein n=1 Tax=Paenibacillus piri TaxID=2547395 RepID=A0A4R5KG55_9BACL|nr:SGNH/GDSL hydrolase family protein [Paenibacillus piri]TDF93200.1 SGNH/GDSL hydrolase family protein [Paenibacillus piri]